MLMILVITIRYIYVASTNFLFVVVFTCSILVGHFNMCLIVLELTSD
jgi:hypothetical protein